VVPRVAVVPGVTAAMAMAARAMAPMVMGVRAMAAKAAVRTVAPGPMAAMVPTVSMGRPVAVSPTPVR
jgi:precorrin-2 methylase